MKNNFQHHFCSFDQSLDDFFFSKLIPQNAFVVVPTEYHKRVLIRKFMKQWELTNTRFATMEALKDMLFSSSLPLLKEEKRSLVFYKSLTEQDKRFFNINSYFQSIELGHHFFDLWQEFAEEEIDPELDPQQFLFYDCELLDWQLDLYSRLRAIKLQYKSLITQLGFQDAIFTHTQENLDFFAVGPAERFYVVNQFYFTRLEKTILTRLLSKAEVHIISQIPASFMNPDSLTVERFDIEKISEYRCRNVNVYEGQNAFAMMMSVLSTLENNSELRTVVDLDPTGNTYQPLISGSIFQKSHAMPFRYSSLYKTFYQLYQLLDAIHIHAQNKVALLDLSALLDAISCQEFIAAFDINTQQATEALRDLIYTLFDHECHAIDLEAQGLKYFGCADHKGVPLLKSILQTLNSVVSFESLSDWTHFISHSNFSPLKVSLEHEHHCSDFMDTFYRMLIDFESLESLGIVTDWTEIFGSARNPWTLGKNLLKLFLDYMKAKTIQLSLEETSQPSARRTTMLDTRNIDYDSVALINVLEGKLPHAKQPPFLFTERQRQYLGLKTYEDIRLRERYYFFRLVLTADTVFLFTQNDIENNIQTSSFVEELKWIVSPSSFKAVQVPEPSYLEMMNSFFQHSDYKAPLRVKESFFALSFSPETLGESLDLTIYSLSELADNPFVYYIRHVGGVDEPSFRTYSVLSKRLLGNFAHDFMNAIWTHWMAKEPQYLDIETLSSKDYLYQTLNRLLDHPKYIYLLPEGHVRVYFDHILVPLLIDGARNLFSYLKELELDQRLLRFIPEQEHSTRQERQYKTLLPSAENPLQKNVRFRMRADLRIEDLDGSDVYIFDYKTGKNLPQKDQLVLYSWFYYINKADDRFDRINSYFVSLFEKEIVEMRKGSKDPQTLFQDIKETLLDILFSLLGQGYALPPQKSKAEKMGDITRNDLKRKTLVV
jgi:hypothetical protein